MARVALTIGGGAAGAFFGNPQLGMALGSLAGSLLFPTPGSSSSTSGPRLNDLTVQSSAYGAPIPELWGVMRIAGNLIWSSGITEYKHVEVHEQGGKGAPTASQTTTTYTYSSSFAVALCEGEIEGIGRIWASGELLVDYRTSATPTELWESTSLLDGQDGGLTIYNGSETQEVDPTMESYLGVGNVPAYRGLAYLVFSDLQLEKYGNRIPNLTVEVIRNGTTETFDRMLRNDTVLDVTTRNHSLRVEDGVLIASEFTFNPAIGGSRSKIYDLDGNFVTYENVGSANSLACLPYYGGELGGLPCYMDGLLKSYMYVDGRKVYPESGTLRGWCVTPDGTRLMLVYSIGSTMWWSLYDSNLTLLTNAEMGLSYFEYAWPGYTNPITLEDDGIHLWRTKYQSGRLVLCYELQSDNTWSEIYNSGDAPAKYGCNGDYNGIYAAKGMFWMVGSNGQRAIFTRLPRPADGVVPLSTIVQDICTSTGLEAGDIDVTALTDDVTGYARSSVTSGRQALQPLQQGYAFDAVETSGKLTFVPRGGSSVVTITEDDLAAHQDGDTRPGPIEIVRSQETELPVRVRVTYLDQARDYQEGTQYASRLITESSLIQDVQLPLAMSSTDAARAADVLLKDAWTQRQRVTFTLGPQYMYLDPTDVVTLSMDNGTTHTIYIQDMSIAIPGLITVSGVTYSASIYSSSVDGIDGDYDSQTITSSGPTRLVPVDSAMIYDTDNSMGIYLSAGGVLSGWPGCAAFASSDSGVTWSQVTSTTSGDSLGVTTTTLSPGSTTVFDNENTVNVRLYQGTLSSSTQAGVLNGANMCIIGTDGAWEILQFINATLESDGTYTLSGLLRGRRGTEWAMDSHTSTDWFVLVDSEMLRHNMSTDRIGSESRYRGVTFGSRLANSLEESLTIVGEALVPYSPTSIKGSRDSSGNLTITWIRRGRVGGAWRDNVGVVLGEDSESYDVEILDGATVVRTFSAVSSATQSYTAANQVTDFGSAQSSILVRIYQLSAQVGRGHYGEATI